MKDHPHQRVASMTSKLVSGAVLGAVLLSVEAADVPGVANPFEGATGYVNPDFVEQVNISRQLAVPELNAPMQIVARQSTAIWLDSLEAIDGYNGTRMSLEDHLTHAAAQQQKINAPVTISVVLYSLPNRDCAASASNGILHGEVGLKTYREDFIEPIADLFQDSRFSRLRIVALIEPDSLPNLVTNQAVPACREAFENNIYSDSIAYALSRFSTIGNVYSYLDIAHSGWLGWDTNRARAVDLYKTVVAASGSLDNISGVVTNVSGYSPVEEPLLPDPEYVIGDRMVKAAAFYSYNRIFDERDFAVALHEDFLAAGFPATFGVLIDTSRNGWGGEFRPDAVAWHGSVNAYVDAARIDRRSDRGNWCNPLGAGIGERPRANPYGDNVIHAFVWVKPPGESDGTSDATQSTPDEQGKSFDPSCDPKGENDQGLPTNAMPDAPAAGDWFHEQFEMLVRNGNPALVD